MEDVGNRIARRRKRLVARRALVCVASLGLICIGVEATMRTSIACGRPERLANPGAYFDSSCDSEYWSHLHTTRFGAERSAPVSSTLFHPDLGWYIRQPSNLALHARIQSVERVEDEKGLVVLFGDSFMHGTTPRGTRILDELRDWAPDRRMVDCSVPGYGLDQIVLNLSLQAPTIRNSDVFLGILTTDLDRAYLPITFAPKPFYTLDEDEIVLHTEHLSPDIPAAISALHTKPASYLARYLWVNVPRHYHSWVLQDRWECAQIRKEDICNALLEFAAETCRNNELRCVVVLFHESFETGEDENWRATLVTDAAQRLDLEMIDTHRIFHGPSASEAAVYGPDGHPTPYANELVAMSLARGL